MAGLALHSPQSIPLLPSVLFISGKGGVGKTTLAATLAWIGQQRGEKVLLLSTDPAHNLSDLFQLPAGGGRRHQINSCLTVLELDPEEELTLYLDQARERILPLLGVDSRPMLEGYFDFIRQSPGSLEAAVFHRLAQLLEGKERSGWQRIICDTAPSGHTLQLLQLPVQLGQWGQLLEKRRQQHDKLQRFLLSPPGEEVGDNLSSIGTYLEKRQLLYQHFRQLLSDSQRCGVVLVLEAQQLAMVETMRTAMQLQHRGVRPYAICLNRLLPPKMAGEPEFYQQRRLLEAQHRREIEQNWAGYPLWYLPLQERDVDGHTLPQLAAVLLGQLHLAVAELEQS